LGQPVIPDNVFLNDLAVDRDNDALYIADTTGVVDGRSNDALIVVDLNTGLARRVLEGHSSVVAEAISVAPDGVPITVEGKPVRVGVNSITIDPVNEWLYYGPMTGTSLYRVRTADLRDTALSSEALAERVERFGKKPVTDGITIDNAGNVYVTDINGNGIGVIRPGGAYEVLMTDEQRLSWPDGLATGPDGKIYATVNQLHRSPLLGAEQRSPEPPLLLVRFTPLAPVTIGR
jgi:sugar lactone lactonase YvrE